MTRLFGGFTDSFYRAYQQGWQQRVALYNLYHLLNHLFNHLFNHHNLFGRSYLAEVMTTSDDNVETLQLIASGN